jgi:hypothetical protein
MQAPAGGVLGTTRSYRLCALKLDSDFDLPALPEWDGPADAPADAICRLGEVPSRLSRPNHVAPLFQTSGAGEYLLNLPGTGRIMVRNGNEITVAPAADSAASNLSAVLTGTIQAVLWHQRDLLPLHASVIVINGSAVALCGHAGVGKSTLAGVSAAQGLGVLADDLCIVDVRGSEEVSVLPNSARLQLWRDALAWLGVATEGLNRALAHKDRYFLDCSSPIPAEPHKLAAVVLMARHGIPPVSLERLRGARAMDALLGSVHARRPGDALGRAQQIFGDFAHMASAGVGFWRLKVPEGPVALREAAAKLPTVLEA